MDTVLTLVPRNNAGSRYYVHVTITTNKKAEATPKQAATKTAVDEKAKSYWAGYFGEYGKAWVRDIPRRVKKALADRKVTAETVAPMAYLVTDDGDLELHGVARLAGGGHALYDVTFAADDGAVQAFDVYTPSASAPAAPAAQAPRNGR